MSEQLWSPNENASNSNDPDRPAYLFFITFVDKSLKLYFHRMNKLIFATLLMYSATTHGQTFAGLGFGVSSGAGFYAEHYFQPKWSLEANIGIPALGFGVNYVVLESRERFQNGRLYSAEELIPRGKKSKKTGRLTAGVTLTGAILPDVGLFHYRFWNLGLHKTIQKTDFGMELGLMRGAIVTGPSGSTYPQYFTSPGLQFTLGRSLFEPGPLMRLKQRMQNL